MIFLLWLEHVNPVLVAIGLGLMFLLFLIKCYKIYVDVDNHETEDAIKHLSHIFLLGAFVPFFFF